MTFVEGASLETLKRVLAARQLPRGDVHLPGRRFWLFDDGLGLAGCGGLEGFGKDRLLRSVAVVADRSGRGTGSKIVGALEEQARSEGVLALYLLTSGAQAFFERLGYTRTDRSFAPTSIASTQQLLALCPSDAAFMIKELS
jgi:amino-acid N-acetyltransferase